ncbi:MAG: PQQ-binding-like beta-propeller repeat protein [Limisphaerales bacterium]
MTVTPSPRRPLRLWPGVVAAGLIVLVRFVLPLVVPDAMMVTVLGGLAGGLVILVWWVFFSRAAWVERLGAVALMIAAVAATARLVHPSVATGMMGLMLPLYAIPVLGVALVAWAVVTRGRPAGFRRVTLAATLLLACGLFTLVRTDGISGAGGSELHWRWSPSAEERLLAEARGNSPLSPLRAEAGARGNSPLRTDEARGSSPLPTGADWPGFRGPERDGVVRGGVQIATNWSDAPPAELWRRPVGPAWSSFAVAGGLFYTQEQRGEEELVVGHRLDTGEPVWRHADAVRFWESNAGAGPRATPAVSRGRVYALGATGLLNALDAADGRRLWSRDVAADTGMKTPMWGFAGSPLVAGDVVLVAAAGRLAAYDAATGQPRWSGPERGGGYSSPHRLSLGGVDQVLLLSDAGVLSVTPADGAVLWEHAWDGAAIVQPALTADGDLLLATGGPSGGLGLRRLAVTRGPGGWAVAERWTSRGLKPYFSDFVVHRGHAFGIEGSLLACIELEGGERQWKDGRYGSGQLLLLPDQDLLLVLGEQGGLALVSAMPDGFRELARFPAIRGKTWNHPVLAGDVLLVRNSEEMAAFRLARAGR